jgi:hypothetical protein
MGFIVQCVFIILCVMEHPVQLHFIINGGGGSSSSRDVVRSKAGPRMLPIKLSCLLLNFGCLFGCPPPLFKSLFPDLDSNGCICTIVFSSITTILLCLLSLIWYCIVVLVLVLKHYTWPYGQI